MNKSLRLLSDGIILVIVHVMFATKAANNLQQFDDITLLTDVLK